MNDTEILHRLLLDIYADEGLTQAAKRQYETFVQSFSEHGFEHIFPLDAMSEEQEAAILVLRKCGYVETAMEYHGSDGHFYYVDLRGKKFLEYANEKQAVVGMQDSGKRETFSTGAVRDTAEGKSRPDLFSPFALERVGEWLRLGSLKYTENNWMKGMDYSRVVASLHRHLMKYMQRDRTEDHLAALIVNSSFLMHYDAMIERGVLPESLDDLPKYDEIPGVHRNKDEPIEY